jgi:hypothetical protein
MNDFYQWYDFSSLFTDRDQQEAKNRITSIIDSGAYFKNSPKFQTQVNMFGIQDDVWLKFRFSFIFSVFMYLGREVPIHNLQAWSFKTNNEIEEDREDLWHTHQYTEGKTTVSGIYYLHIPEDADYATSGTEFAPGGIKNPEKLLTAPQPRSWLIYPGKIFHRPAAPQSKDYRYIIAADMEF